MTTTLEKPTAQSNILVLNGITWSKFEEIQTAFQDLSFRFTYLDELLEIIMILGNEHEYYKSTLTLLLETYMMYKGIKFYVRGSATLGNKEITGQKEPDEAYNIHNKKPLPDLIIEIIVTSGNINILEIYKRLGIPEVWLYQDGVLEIYHLDKDYQKIEKSILLPDLDIKMFVKYINYYDQYDAVNDFLKELN